MIGLTFVNLYQKLRIRLLPGIRHPKIHWLFGHIPFVRDNLHRYCDADVDLLKNNPDHIFQIAIPGNPIILRTDDHRIIKHILHDNFDNYIKLDPLRPSFVSELLGNGIFAADGEDAKRQRKIASHMFSMRLLRDHAAKSFLDHGYTLLNVLAKYSDSQNNQYIDMQDYFARYTMDSFADIAFGVNLDSLNSSLQPEFAFAFDQMQELVIQRKFYPEIVWRMQRFIQNSREAQITMHKKTLHQIVGQIVDQRMADYKEVTHGNIVSLFINQALKDSDGKENLDLDSLKIELTDIIKNFLLAGRDTTAVLLTWSLIEFCLNPQWEEKCLNEIKDVLRDSEPTHDNIQNLELLGNFINEVLRLHAPVPNDVKIAVKDDIWPNGTKIPAGTHCSYSPYAAGRSEKNWGSDCLEFNPQRWENGAQYQNLDDKKDFDYKFITFNAGPRICLGRSMAYTEAKICLALLLPRFRFQIKASHSFDLKPSFVLKLAHGLPIKVFPRYIE